MAVLPVSLVLILSLCASVATARTAYLPCTEPVDVRFPSGPVSPLLVPEILPNGIQVVRVQIRFSRPVLVGFFSDFGRFDDWGGQNQRFVGRLPPISMVGNLANGDEVWEPMAQSYAGTSNDIIEVMFQMLAGRKVTDIFFRSAIKVRSTNSCISYIIINNRSTSLLECTRARIGPMQHLQHSTIG